MKAWGEQAAQFIQMKGRSCRQHEVHHRAIVRKKTRWDRESLPQLQVLYTNNGTTLPLLQAEVSNAIVPHNGAEDMLCWFELCLRAQVVLLC